MNLSCHNKTLKKDLDTHCQSQQDLEDGFGHSLDLFANHLSIVAILDSSDVSVFHCYYLSSLIEFIEDKILLFITEEIQT